jgi:two-component system, chemotaxis family, chemotaxis protein CheY
MGKKILVVDDSRTVRQLVSETLAPAGYEVLHAADGFEGAGAIARGGDIELVICDVNMPKLGGIEMVAIIKQRPQNAKLNVLMLTTEGSPASIARAKAAGANGWIVKPFKPDVLLATVKRLAGSA